MNATMDYFVQLSQPNDEDSTIRPTEIGIISDGCAEQPSLGGFSRGDTILARRASNQIPNDKPNSGDNAREPARFNLAIGSVARFWKTLVEQPQIILMAHAIRLIRVEAPKSVQVGEPIRLRCLYELRGEKLQSLAWYKNGREFYRYQPAERRQTVLTFSLAGVNVDVSEASDECLILINLTIANVGKLRRCPNRETVLYI